MILEKQIYETKWTIKNDYILAIVYTTKKTLFIKNRYNNVTDQDRTNEERGLSRRKEEMRQKILSRYSWKISYIYFFSKLSAIKLFNFKSICLSEWLNKWD